jgi:hypothetical protein
MSLPARLCCPTSENAVKAKFTGMLIYPIAPVLSEVGLVKVTGTRTGSRARAAGDRENSSPLSSRSPQTPTSPR